VNRSIFVDESPSTVEGLRPGAAMLEPQSQVMNGRCDLGGSALRT